MTGLQELRRTERPLLPTVLHDLSRVAMLPTNIEPQVSPQIRDLFPETWRQTKLVLSDHERTLATRPYRVGVVLSGGQAAGGHNVIIGLFDALQKLYQGSELFGFLNGPSGILKNEFRVLTADVLDTYRNTGGFDLIGSGRTKLETPEQFAVAQQTLEALALDGLVIIGGDDSNTNAALLAEYLKAKGSSCRVVGAPKTVDGDLRSEDIEISFGFDTACKTYSGIIGSIARDALSAKKYYHFIKVMGRSASHIALECALQTHPNSVLIGEQLAKRGATLTQIAEELADVICQRAQAGKNYGVILIPEGVIEFIPDCRKLITELNALLLPETGHAEVIKHLESAQELAKHLAQFLSTEAMACFRMLPIVVQMQLLLDRDPHGNVQVSKIETERLFIAVVEEELKRRAAKGLYKGKFSAQPHFLGYEGRSCFPSHFDSNYCYTLGYICALLIEAKATGYIACVRGLILSVDEWVLGGVPLTSLMHLEERSGKQKPVLAKTLIDLDSRVFTVFEEQRSRWVVDDAYLYPGPIQFFGPEGLTLTVPLTLSMAAEELPVADGD